jgi:hypothetical protein
MLFTIADFSQVAITGHLGPVPQQLRLQMHQLGVQCLSAQSSAAAKAAVIISVQPSSVSAAIRMAEQLKPGFLAVYQPGFQLSHQVFEYLHCKSGQKQGCSWVGGEGVWLLISFGAFGLRHWLRP